MRLANKLTALLVLGNCTVLTAYGWLARQREAAMLERAMERDTLQAGSTLLAAVDATWEVRGREAALALVADASERQEDMAFRWLLPRQLGATALTPEQALRVQAGERVLERSRGSLRMYVPHASSAGERGVLEVTKDMSSDASYVRASTRLLVAATVALVAVSGAIAFVVGRALVGRPMGLLVDRIERIGSGNLSARLDLSRSDEVGALAVALDELAVELQASSARVEAESAARRAALRQLRHAERLATVGRLAAGVAHELGTPLNVVLARSKLASKALGEPDAVRKHLTVIGEQSQRMTKIIRQLLDFARRRESEKAPLELGPAIRRVLEALAPLANERHLRLEHAGVADAWTLADGGQIEQVLTNLVMNAIQASPAGSAVQVVLREVSRTPPPDHGGAEVAHWCLEVVDQGPGVPEELRERVFEPFFTTKDVGEGTGLGLTVVHGIVAEHDGRIEVDAGPAGGSVFRVFLPAASRPAEAPV